MLDSPLHVLARRIAQTRSIDRAAKGGLARELKSLRARLYPSAGQEVVDRVDAAALLMHFLALADDSPPEALQLVARMTAALDERYFAPPPLQANEPAPAPVHPLDGLSAASRLGEIMVHTGIITGEQLDEALRIQKAWRLPLGTCMERLGHATGGQVARALELQKKLRMSAPAPLPAAEAAAAPPRAGLKLDVREGGPSLADILVQRNQLSAHQLERAKFLQRAAGVTLEEALVQLGFLTREQVKQALQVVERQRKESGRLGG